MSGYGEEQARLIERTAVELHCRPRVRPGPLRWRRWSPNIELRNNQTPTPADASDVVREVRLVHDRRLDGSVAVRRELDERNEKYVRAIWLSPTSGSTLQPWLHVVDRISVCTGLRALLQRTPVVALAVDDLCRLHGADAVFINPS